MAAAGTLSPYVPPTFSMRQSPERPAGEPPPPSHPGPSASKCIANPHSLQPFKPCQDGAHNEAKDSDVG